MMSIQYPSADEAATARLGRAIAEVAAAGTVIGLNGPLGAGKTRLVQAVAAGLGVPADTVTSPTFVLINEYTSGRLPVYHFDAYRLCDRDEFAELGPEEYFYGEGICLVEWAERVAELLPPDRVEIEISIDTEDQRLFEIAATGPYAARLLARLPTGIAGPQR